MDPTIVMVLVGVVVFAIVIGVGFAFSGGNPSQDRALKRAQAFSSPASRDSRRRGPAANSPEARRKQIMKSLEDQDRRQKKARLTIGNKLKQAGLRITVPQFWIGGLVFGLVVGVGMMLAHIHPLVALAFGIACGLGLPQWGLNFLANRRKTKFTSAFSDAMDIIVRGIKSGLPVHDCLKIIGRESPEPLAGEFSRLVENIGMGMSLDQGLEKLNEHMPTPEARFFSIVMSIQQKTGGNLAEALNNLSAVLRSRKLMREKVKALSAEATSSAAIIGALPPGVIIMITLWTPSYMAPMFVDHRGWLMLGASGIWMAIGVFVMVRMINFKF
ncbi:MAG TPA: type II secretion system F family protein [Caulobacteraceae bacterium]|jgi:tight adherence protein B